MQEILEDISRDEMEPRRVGTRRIKLNNKIQLDATYYYIMLMLGSTCFGHHYAHHQELTTIALVTT